MKNKKHTQNVLNCKTVFKFIREKSKLTLFFHEINNTLKYFKSIL